MSAASALHIKCRNCIYPRTNDIQREFVPDERVDWRLSWPEYKPTVYTSPNVSGKPWADPDIQKDKSVQLQFNQIDGTVDRTSFMGVYQIDSNGLPLNPRGRTGITGRGVLGRWGPNHAADPIVTRWKMDEKGGRYFDPDSKHFVLQFVSIRRKDSGEWAIPGGMVDAGEKYTSALKREFSEEALNSTQASGEEVELIKKRVEDAFQNGVEVYKGYVDDPRNTDNAWMETVAVNFHDETGDGLGVFPLVAGDDAVAVRWTDIGSDLQLYASHRDFIELVAKLRSARW